MEIGQPCHRIFILESDCGSLFDQVIYKAPREGDRKISLCQEQRADGDNGWGVVK